MTDPDALKTTGAAIVAVGDSAQLRLFESAAPLAPLREIMTITNPDARLHEGDLVADRGGRKKHRPMQGGHSAFGGDSVKRHRVEDFAETASRHIHDLLQRLGAARLYLVAEPGFLGLLRQRLDQGAQRLLAGEIAKSLTGRPIDEIRAALPQRL
jgi:protein required for attachment to host cells